MYDDRETEHHNNEVNIDDISYTETINYTDKYLPKTKGIAQLQAGKS